jgi:hypothetical protein
MSSVAWVVAVQDSLKKTKMVVYGVRCMATLRRRGTEHLHLLVLASTRVLLGGLE